MAYRNYNTANGIMVDQLGNGDYTTITAAMAAAVSGQTIFVRDGTYTENFSGKPGVTVTAFTGDASEPNVIINGTVTFSTAGTFTVANCKLQTNNALAVNLTGSAACTFNLYNCAIFATNNTAIGASNTNSVSFIYMLNCTGDIRINSVQFFSLSQANVIFIESCFLDNSGLSSIQSTASLGILLIKFSEIDFPIITSGTCRIVGMHALFASTAGTIPITHNSTAVNCNLDTCNVAGGTVAAITIGAGATLISTNCVLGSTNPGVVAGAGTLLYQPICFPSTGVTLTVSTATPKTFGPQMLVPGGITFDGTNFLANYATGTFTPTMTGASTAGATTYSVQNGSYTRIGNLCFYSANVSWTGATGTGQINLGGFPFTINASDIGSALAFGVFQTLAIGAGLIPTGSCTSGTTHAALASYNATTGAFLAINVAAVGNLQYSGHFQI